MASTTHSGAPTVNQRMDYYPFGMVMPGREYLSEQYKYGFNSQEADLEMAKAYSFEFRIFDSRIGRFYSIDPLVKVFPWNSPFAFCENRVIDGRDFEGKEWKDAKGNFIFVMTEIKDMVGEETMPRTIPGEALPKNEKVKYHIVEGYVFVGDGVPVKIQIIESAEWVSDGQKIDLSQEQINYNCHGLTTINKLGLIDSESGNSRKILSDKAGIPTDTKLEDKTSTDFSKIKNGDIVIFVNPTSGTVEHSAVYNGSTGKYTSKNGLNNESEYSLDELKATYNNATNVSYFTPIANKTLTNTKHAEKSSQQLLTGFTQYRSIKKVQKDIKNQQKQEQKKDASPKN